MRPSSAEQPIDELPSKRGVLGAAFLPRDYSRRGRGSAKDDVGCWTYLRARRMESDARNIAGRDGLALLRGGLAGGAVLVEQPLELELRIVVERRERHRRTREGVARVPVAGSADVARGLYARKPGLHGHGAALAFAVLMGVGAEGSLAADSIRACSRGAPKLARGVLIWA